MSDMKAYRITVTVLLREAPSPSTAKWYVTNHLEGHHLVDLVDVTEVAEVIPKSETTEEKASET